MRDQEAFPIYTTLPDRYVEKKINIPNLSKQTLTGASEKPKLLFTRSWQRNNKYYVSLGTTKQKLLRSLTTNCKHKCRRGGVM